MSKLSNKAINAANPNPEKEYRLWDDSPRGLGLRIKPTGTKTFFVQYLSPVTGKKTRHTIGQYGRVTLDQARDEARRIMGSLSENKDLGMERRQERETARSNARTVAELCDDYMRDALAGMVTYRGRPKKKSTLDIDAGRMDRHIKPVLGNRLVREIALADINRFFHAVRTGKTAKTVKTGNRGVARVTGGEATATRTVELLGSIFSYAIRHGLRPDNPVAGFERPPTKRRDRVLSPEEYKALEQAFRDLEAEGANKTSIAAYRSLALTGCRKSEIFSLRRAEFDRHNQALRLPDTKTGQQTRAVGEIALEAIETAPTREANEFAFPAAKGDSHIVGVKIFREAVKRAMLEGVTLHTLRHSFASVALELEYSELTIAGLLGHRMHSMTSRYAHHVDRSLVAAANRVSRTIAERMGVIVSDASATGEIHRLNTHRA